MAKTLTPDVLKDNYYSIVEFPLAGTGILDVMAKLNGRYTVAGDVFEMCGGKLPDDVMFPLDNHPGACRTRNYRSGRTIDTTITGT